MSNPLADMDKPDAIFCIGTNMTECHPVAATRIKRALKRGAKMIVADPRKIPLARKADVYLPLRVAATGWASVMLVPMQKITSGSSMSASGLLIAPRPRVAARPATVGLCQARLQLST